MLNVTLVTSHDQAVSQRGQGVEGQKTGGYVINRRKRQKRNQLLDSLNICGGCLFVRKSPHVFKPKLLSMLITKVNTISFWGCIYQMYFFLAMACADVLLLAAMAYDRYLAICHPLHYVALMSLRQSAGLAMSAWIIGFLDPSGHAVLMSRLSFCASHVIDHFFCDIIPLLKISCSDTSEVELINFLEGSLITSSAFVLTLVSYIFIISTIMKIKSAEGRRKAFSTCSSHLTCVIIFYGTLICLYMRPTTSYTPKKDKFVSLLYGVIVPVLKSTLSRVLQYDLGG
ncbi:putative olfactory receptor 1F12P [Ranitomeya imitator]|uniref:putative olfactory receptor 1F12P n=1 Tax=Ranitomeya imitator TaxID=111125 RepID=UPI0037E7DE58